MLHDISVAAISATTTSVLCGEIEIPEMQGEEGVVVAVRFVPAANFAALGATNFSKLQLRDFTANTAAPVVIAELSFGAHTATAETELDFTLSTATTTVSGTGTAEPVTHVSLGDILDVFAVFTGTATATPAGKVVIETQ